MVELFSFWSRANAGGVTGHSGGVPAEGRAPARDAFGADRARRLHRGGAGPASRGDDDRDAQGHEDDPLSSDDHREEAGLHRSLLLR